LKAERQPQKSGETKGDYTSRMTKSGVEALKLKSDFEDGSTSS